jgi:MFS-type transporter involved in bile tolerance (Atg22 family)
MQNEADNCVAVAISAFGSGFTAGLRSFLTSLVPPNEVALLYTLLAIFSSIGSLIGVPLLALTFSKGIEMGGFARGFPFFFTAVVYVLSGISIWNIRSPQKGEEESSDEDTA